MKWICEWWNEYDNNEMNVCEKPNLQYEYVEKQLNKNEAKNDIKPRHQKAVWLKSS